MFSWPTVCGARPAVMGIVNVTPDSFSDGGRFLDAGAAVAHGLELVAAGADLLDVGGESTRPGATPVAPDDERARVLPVVRRLATEAGVPVSVDTRRASVAADAIEAGAAIVNDVSAGRFDADMARVVAEAGVGFVLVHMLGDDPRTMQDDPRYDDVVDEVGASLGVRVDAAREAGVHDDALCADPGIGFGKRVSHNLELLTRLPELVARAGAPVLVGTSRKTFIGRVLAEATGATAPLPPEQRDDGTLATVVWAVDRGAAVVRVHEVEPAAHAVRLLTLMHSLDARAVA